MTIDPRTVRFCELLNACDDDMAECCLVDLLADVLRWCKATGTEFDRALSLAATQVEHSHATLADGSKT